MNNPSTPSDPAHEAPPCTGGAYLFDPATGRYTVIEQPAPAQPDLRRDASVPEAATTPQKEA